MSDNSSWSVTPDRALHVEEDGGCWVELTRNIELPGLGRGAVVLDCAFYGPVPAWELQF